MSERIRVVAESGRKPQEERKAASKSRDMVENDLAQLKDKIMSRCDDHAEAVSKLSERRRVERRGRGEITVPPWWYIPSLVGLGFGELFINYEALREYFGVPLFALLMALGICIAIGIGSHIHGTWIKQWNVQFRQQGGDTHRWASRVMFVIITVFVFLSFVAVAWTRYGWVESLIVRGLEGMNIWDTVLQGLIPNIIIWLIGIFIAFTRHDVSPDLQTLEKDRRRAYRRHKRVRRSLVNKIVSKRKEYESDSDEKREAVLEVTNKVIHEVVEKAKKFDPETHEEVLKVSDLRNLLKIKDTEDEP